MNIAENPHLNKTDVTSSVVCPVVTTGYEDK